MGLREPVRMSFTVVVDVQGSPLLYKALRHQIEQTINSFSNLRFVSINENQLPDHFSVKDPDKPPTEDFK